jgi:hypothetical protein
VDSAPPAGGRAPQRLIRGLRSEYNCRQGVSIVGGRGYVFEQCKFNHTGQGGAMSSPGSGVDIEAENGKKNRDFAFTDCEFVDNAGAGMVADSGDSEGASFTRCLFVGTHAWSVWPFKPRFRFNDCRFVGSSVRAFGDPLPERATQFHDCTFLDDPTLSPTGEVIGKDYPIYDLAEARNVLFSRCTFRLTHDGLLPWSWYAIYEDCTMTQRSPKQAFPKGLYRGRSTITGNVDMYGTTTAPGAELVINGKRWG